MGWRGAVNGNVGVRQGSTKRASLNSTERMALMHITSGRQYSFVV